MRISDWSSDVCSSDLADLKIGEAARGGKGAVDALDNLQRVGKAIVKPCENAEFIPTEAAQYVPLTKAGLQPPRNGDDQFVARNGTKRSEEHTSELQSLMRISYAVFCLKKKNKPMRNKKRHSTQEHTEIVREKDKKTTNNN